MLCVVVNRWCLEGVQADRIAEVDSMFEQQKDAGVFMGWTRDADLYDPFVDIYNDVAISQLFGNHRPNDPTHRIIS